jgi:enoyl-CoA hydratase
LGEAVILGERLDAIAVIRMNRPESLNILSRAMLENLSDAFKQLEGQSDLRAVILTGSGEVAFCMGTDTLDHSEAQVAAEEVEALCHEIERFPVPVIAAINGIAADAGFELALACHLRFASTNARLSRRQVELHLSAVDGANHRLKRELGHRQAIEAMNPGKSLSAENARQLGLVIQVTDQSNLLAAAKSLATDISKLAPLAVHACLTAVTHGLELPLQEGLALESELFASLFATQDMREGTSAFLEKRAPVFTGT